MSTSSILYDITIYGAHTCLSGPYKNSLRFSESGRILKQSIRQIKFTWSVNYVSEIFHSSISDTIGTQARHINRAAVLCCHVALTYGAAILRLENEARHANFEKALFQSVTKYVQHPLKTRFTQWRLFYTQGPFFFALGPLFCALVREVAIFAICKRCANKGFACKCEEKLFWWHYFCRFFPYCWVKFTQVRLANFPIHISLNSPCGG